MDDDRSSRNWDAFGAPLMLTLSLSASWIFSFFSDVLFFFKSLDLLVGSKSQADLKLSSSSIKKKGFSTTSVNGTRIERRRERRRCRSTTHASSRFHSFQSFDRSRPHGALQSLARMASWWMLLDALQWRRAAVNASLSVISFSNHFAYELKTYRFLVDWLFFQNGNGSSVGR